MKGKYTDAPEVAEMAQELIEQFHPHLEDAPIRFVFRLGKWAQKGKQLFGQARVISDLAAFLAGDGEDEESFPSAVGEPFFVIAIWKPGWDTMTGDERRYILDHELQHCAVEEREDKEGNALDPRLYTAPHDLEEFGCIIERHGLLLPDRRAFAKLCAAAMSRQPGLPMDGDELKVTISTPGEPPVHTTGRGMRQAADLAQAGRFPA